MTYGKAGKEKVNRPKLHGADKIKYEIHDQIAAILPKCQTFDQLEKRLKQGGIYIKYKYRSGAEETIENIQGLSFEKSGCSFKGSEIDKKFSYGNLKKTLSANLNEAWEKIKDMIMPVVVKTQRSAESISPKPVERVPASVRQEHKRVDIPAPVKRNPVVGRVEVTDEQDKTLRSDGHIYLENMERRDGTGKFSAYVFLDDSGKKVFSSNENPDNMVKYGDITIRLRDKIQVEKGYVVKAKMKWWGGIDYQYPFVWKDTKTNEIKHSFADPRIPKEVHEKENKEFQKKIQQNITVKKKGPKLG